MSDSNRQIHAVTADGREVVRYDRAGKWYVEGPDGFQPITLGDAAYLATLRDSRVHLGRPGGKAFDARVRRALRAGEAAAS